ncbi:hypothetical protein CANTEDRAFT_113247 [Yamadazyma tenuis ATCC 10573]|uniref:Uncharacterized protein n=1 Tax=Candida tenuis (strain ATCC 10573 / BCRC 21748 / CBS 615 / JCM 9827 / NBRC 10315 / NRRL Y-1498 / VKM Y-70) TaxID=590646 RepID=G3B1M0_CANTC|nr:uncharacterized protein CANTEDRAFT_113247 [Yamadazyma tenuis ATCC 10573]EGV64478.1 hypothetical protein CANTEDRAFT_113247 [Yamadazyma tenuis ATCC 10573]
MLPPNQSQIQQQLQLHQQSQSQQQAQQIAGQTPTSNPTKLSPSLSGPSPVIGNKPSPGEPAGKRGRKQSTSNQTTTPNSAPTPSHLKKEFSTPLTPTSETPNDTSNINVKRKRKGSVVGESPKKAALNKKNDIDSLKEEKDDKTDDSLNVMVPPSALSGNFHDIGQGDQMFSMDVLDSSSGDNQLFGSGSNSNGLEDIDFDFNSFLDGNNDGINTFNWGGVDAVDAIESGDS